MQPAEDRPNVTGKITPAHANETRAASTGNSNIISKTVYSSKLRLIFLVGLEGTGHHYMNDAIDQICDIPQVACPDVCSMARVMYPGLATPDNADQYRKARLQIRQELKVLAATVDGFVEGHAGMLGFGKCRGNPVGMMSFPNYNGDAKAVQYVDFRILAEEAEHAGVDLRIVYLARPARDVLISDTVHHRYGKTFMKETRALLANTDVIHSTFRELAPDFVTCFRYDDMSSKEQAERVATFTAPTEFIAQRFATTMLQVQNHNSKGERRRETTSNLVQELTNPDGSKHFLVERLQQKLDAIEWEYCGLSLPDGAV